MFTKLSCILILPLFISMLSAAEPFTWRVSKDGIFVTVTKGLNPRDTTISQEYQMGGGDGWGTNLRDPNVRMMGIFTLAPLLLSGRDLASVGDPMYIAQRMWPAHSQDSVLARLRAEGPAADETPRPLQNIEQLLALRIAMDNDWQAALPLSEQLLNSEDPFMVRAAQQAIAVLADSPRDSGSPPSLPSLEVAVSSLPNDSYFIVQIDSRQAPRWRNPQRSIRQLNEFVEVVKYAVTGGQVDAAMVGDFLLIMEEQTVLPAILAERYGNLRVDRTLLALTPSQEQPLGFHLLIEGAFTRDQLAAIARDSLLSVNNDLIDFGFMQAALADGQLRIFTKGADRSTEGPAWFDTSAATDTFLYAATNPVGIQTLGPYIDPFSEQLADLIEATLQIRTQGADLLISSTLHFQRPAITDELRQFLSVLEINQPKHIDGEQASQGISIWESTRFFEFSKPIWAERKISGEDDLFTIELTWPAADLSDLLSAVSQFRPAWEEWRMMGGINLDMQSIVSAILNRQAARDAEANE